jgi:hypothetical protein
MPLSDGGIAQLVERFNGIEEARGSNPLTSTKQSRHRMGETPLETYLESRPAGWRRLIHLSEAQKGRIGEILERHPLDGQRPSFEEYCKAEAGLSKKSRVTGKLTGIVLSNCRPGFMKGEVVPSLRFNAQRDLAPGYGLFSMGDSGSNHTILHADRLVWTWIWNWNRWSKEKIAHTTRK